jgi:4a-hydroxytetrahydrobiopterin dehydratase
MERRKLSDEEVAESLEKLDSWEYEDTFLLKEYEFENFAQALEFVNKVGALAEEADHHPDISFGWGYAEIALTTHDVEGVTEHDFALAEKIDNL